MVSQALSLHECGGRHVAVMFVAWPWWVLLHCVVSQSWLLGHGGFYHAMLCCGHNRCVTPHDVAVSVVVLHGGVMVAVVAWHEVSQALHSM